MKDLIVGYILWDNGPYRPETMRRWYDKNRTAGPAKIYKTKSVALRYADGKTVKPVYVKVDEDAGN